MSNWIYTIYMYKLLYNKKKNRKSCDMMFDVSKRYRKYSNYKKMRNWIYTIYLYKLLYNKKIKIKKKLGYDVWCNEEISEENNIIKKCCVNDITWTIMSYSKYFIVVRIKKY